MFHYRYPCKMIEKWKKEYSESDDQAEWVNAKVSDKEDRTAVGLSFVPHS